MYKEIKYYLFLIDKKYDNDPLYAYTSSKIIRKMFLDSRNMKMFKEKKVFLDKKEISFLAHEESSKMLYEYDFTLGKTEIRLPITLIEKVTMENFANNLINNFCYENERVPDYYIFKEKYNELIRNVLFLGDFLDYRPDFLNIFIRFYGKTLNLKGDYLK